MLELLKDELPTNQVLPATGSGANDFAYAYGREVGYRQAITTLELMAVPLEGMDSIPATFEEQPE
tara:strand:+ start:155 stop:349 length:195 start_codon:yes stop_codon:yes gene_type:complete